jgi:hypothetical protein
MFSGRKETALHIRNNKPVCAHNDAHARKGTSDSCASEGLCGGNGSVLHRGLKSLCGFGCSPPASEELRQTPADGLF